MVTSLLSGGPAFRLTARQCLDALGPKALAEVAVRASRHFSNHIPISTVFSGNRPDVAMPQDLAADLEDLIRVLPEGCVNRDLVARDRFADEPRFVSYIRQLEGHPPQPLAVLTPPNENTAEDAVTEAGVMGLTLAPGPRHVALRPPPFVEIEHAEEGRLTFSASVSWEDLCGHAARAGLFALDDLRRFFANPLAAADAGAFGGIRAVQRFGRTWAVHVVLPPQTVGIAGGSWYFEDDAVAEAVVRSVARSHVPLLIEARPALDIETGAAAGLLRRTGIHAPSGRGSVLTVLCAGVARVRRAALRAAAAQIGAAGGRRMRDGPGFDPEFHDAVVAAAGFGRLVRLTDSRPAPPGALVRPLLRAVRGKLTGWQVLWYVRDLAQSVGEAQRLLGLIEDVDRPDDDSTDIHGSDLTAHG